jgi:ubiquinone/menaquinone biosynthesis C-methylase UbiE
VGIDVRENACRRARVKMAERRLADRVEIVHGDASEYAFQAGTYDAAACIGATFIWGGFGPSVGAMTRAVRPGCRLAIGEAYWTADRVPPDFAQAEQSIPTERHILETAREKGLDVEAVVRASRDEWDRYESGNWRGLIRWIQENPDHPERRQVVEHLHDSQDEYFRYGRQYFGWAIYVLAPAVCPEDE